MLSVVSELKQKSWLKSLLSSNGPFFSHHYKKEVLSEVLMLKWFLGQAFEDYVIHDNQRVWIVVMRVCIQKLLSRCMHWLTDLLNSNFWLVVEASNLHFLWEGHNVGRFIKTPVFMSPVKIKCSLSVYKNNKQGPEELVRSIWMWIISWNDK